MDYIFIDTKGKVEKVGLVEGGNLTEFYMEEKSEETTLGNIYRARVEDVVKGMEAAFVDIGREKNSYLHLKQALPKEKMHNKERPYIDEVLKEGQDIIVQIIKEASGSKGAKVSAHIEIKGRYIVLTPYSRTIKFSKKISKDTRDRLKKTAGEIVREDIGVVFRTAAGGIGSEAIVDEYNMLLDLYKKIEREKNFLPCPKLIHSEPDLGYQVLRDVYQSDIEKILVNDKSYYDYLIDMDKSYPFKFSHKLELDEEFSIRHDRKLYSDIKSSLGRRVDLESGAYLIIDQLEAFTVVDVNSGSFIGKSSLRDTMVRANIEAAREIARQIRLRDIGGIILIDFIDMKNKEDRNKLIESLKGYIKRDRNKANFIDITKLGIVELTRAKRRKTNISRYYSICPECEGTGKIFIDI